MRWLVGILAMLLGAGGVFSQDSHHFKARYLLWKHFAVGDWRSGVRYLNVDVPFRTSFDGKGREEMSRWFPDLRPKKTLTTLDPESASFLKDKSGEWIGDTLWFVWYREGVVADI